MVHRRCSQIHQNVTTLSAVLLKYFFEKAIKSEFFFLLGFLTKGFNRSSKMGTVHLKVLRHRFLLEKITVKTGTILRKYRATDTRTIFFDD